MERTQQCQYRTVAIGTTVHANYEFLIYEEMRKYLVIHEEVISHIWMTLQPIHSKYLSLTV
jgi:hypothetical protein